MITFSAGISADGRADKAGPDRGGGQDGGRGGARKTARNHQLAMDAAGERCHGRQEHGDSQSQSSLRVFFCLSMEGVSIDREKRGRLPVADGLTNWGIGGNGRGHWGILMSLGCRLDGWGIETFNCAP